MMNYLKEKLFENNIYYNAYLLCIGIVMLLRGFSITHNSITYYTLFTTGCLLLLVKIYKDEWALKEILFIVVLLAVIMTNYYITKETSLLFSFFILIGLKNIDINKVLMVILVMSVLSYSYIIGGNLLGFFPDNIIEMARNDEIITRNSLGFRHPNLLHLNLLKIYLLIVLLFHRKLNIVYFIVLFSINLLIYNFSLSRSGFFAINLLLLLILLSKNNFMQRVILQLAIYIQFILFTLTILVATVLQNTIVFTKFNLFFTGRFWYVFHQLEKPFTLFGYNFSGINTIFDNSYSYVLMVYGIVITVAFLYFYYKTAKVIYKNNNVILAIIFIIISLHMFIEGYIVYAIFNLTLFFVAKYLFGEMEVFKIREKV